MAQMFWSTFSLDWLRRWQGSDVGAYRLQSRLKMAQTELLASGDPHLWCQVLVVMTVTQRGHSVVKVLLLIPITRQRKTHQVQDTLALLRVVP